ncbi:MULTISPECIES: hypothetical protein [unclassified Breznakia]|uniref:hypothetical protein n=1 Tax=unclassified Breznakia TaxID=2623764 RepID=UPI00247582CD|nr:MULTISPECIES: hypothetical protein [unclassified Breznakia]MDH6365965.1 hypothetical protein [Breznakia sp. PH1-1]MDH6403103.1 hypothetical protein [Breznakia sp. PF1-11]MDH6410812.1 hypothetical protein [Breznakia sp. PFB1-11]MDH6413131.1 hypothetical protein [Breznakia sp. PFB1-14]MDH6415499.1 hypothetical protein [Breznakia sp. PFB1-4]
MKKISGFVCLLLVLMFTLEMGNINASNDKSLDAGTYFLNIHAYNEMDDHYEQLKVTIKGKNTVISSNYNEGIDARDFEYNEKNLKKLETEELIKKANALAWSTKDGNDIPIKKVEIEAIDSIESLVTFYTAKNTKTTVHAYANGTEIFSDKEYPNIEGNFNERNWEIEYRSIFTIVFLLLLITPVILSFALMVLMEHEKLKLDDIIKRTNTMSSVKTKRRGKWFILIVGATLLALARPAYANEQSVYRLNIKEITLDRQTYLSLIEDNKFEEYITDIVGVQLLKQTNEQEVSIAYTIDQEKTQLMVKLDEESDRSKIEDAKQNINRNTDGDYVSRSLRIGEHATLIPIWIAIVILLISIPIIFMIKRRKR